jgi:hypothetical protein
MDHHRNPVRLRRAINCLQLLHAIQVIIGIKQLVRRMDLDQPYAQPYQVVHHLMDVQRVPRKHAASRKQPLRILLAVVRHPWVYFVGETHRLRRNIINEHRPLHADGIHILQQRLGRPAVLQDVLIMPARFLHHLKRPGPEHLDGLNMDVAVSDLHFCFNPERSEGIL